MPTWEEIQQGIKDVLQPLGTAINVGTLMPNYINAVKALPYIIQEKPIPPEIAGIENPSLSERWEQTKQNLYKQFPTTPEEMIAQGVPFGPGPIMGGLTKQGAKWTQKAKDMFGTTDELMKGGYILPEGDVLNLQRNYEKGLRHDSVYKVMPEYDHKNLGTYDAEPMFSYNTDSIRMSQNKSKTLFLDIYNKPTNSQMNTIKDALLYNNDAVISFKNPDGSYLKDIYLDNNNFNELKKQVGDFFKK